MPKMSAPRRAVQACRTCRHRKTRCDARVPKCSLCVDLKVECIYAEPQAPRIDPNTRLVLERLQLLEDRVLASAPRFVAPVSSPNDREHAFASPAAVSSKCYDPPPENDESLLTLPVTHDATANHVYRWPILHAILDAAGSDGRPSSPFEDATDVFMMRTSPQDSSINIGRWLLFDIDGEHGLNPVSPGFTLPLTLQTQVSMYEALVEKFFRDIHVFYPVLRKTEVSRILRNVIDSECFNRHKDVVSLSEHCLLLLVLCLGAFAKAGQTPISQSRVEQQLAADRGTDWRRNGSLEDELWGKARLLLGSVTSSDSIEAVQSLLLVRYVTGLPTHNGP